MADLHVVAVPTLTLAGQTFFVIRYALEEALSSVSGLECELSAGDSALPRPGEIIDKEATFTLARSDGSQSRTFVGVVVSAELAPDPDDVQVLRVLVAPAMWNLGQRITSRIFQEMSAPDIVKAVLEEAGVPASQQDFRLQETHGVRVYTAQYRESDLELVQRLCAEEGIYFAIHMVDGKDVVVFGDAPDGLGDIEGTTSLPYFAEMGFAGSADVIYALSRTMSVQSDKVFVRDYDPDKPKLDIEGSSEGTDEGAHALEVYDFPARAKDEATAKHRAKVLLEAMQAKRDTVHAETGSLALVPGLRFSVEGHPYEPLDGAYLVTRSRIAGEQARHFEASGSRGSKQSIDVWGVPATTKYRPARRRREAWALGLQTAITTGPPGEEIHCDAGGHVKVSFHWDREGKKDDTSSRWIRTSQVPTGGSMMLPRVGWEVTVRHMDADGDRPVVMGRVYNALTPPPYALPEGAGKSSVQTATTPGGGSSNEFRMSDAKGSEEMFFNASKDMSTDVKNNATEQIGNDHKKKVGSNLKQSVTNSVSSNVGVNQTLDVSGDQGVNVETFMVDEIKGDHGLSIGGNRDLKVGGDHKRDVGGASTLDVGGNQIDLVVGSVTDQTLGSYTHDVGTALVELTVGDRTVTVAGDRTESVGAAKVIAVAGGRGVEVGGTMMSKVAGAIVNVASGDRVESSGGMLTELAAGAQLIKAANVVMEAETMLTLVMGASILSLTPVSVTFIGLSAKLDGDVADTAALVVDN